MATATNQHAALVEYFEASEAYDEELNKPYRFSENTARILRLEPMRIRLNQATKEASALLAARERKEDAK